MAKNFYEELNKALKSYEEFKPYHQYKLDWIADKIDWCWKFKKISEDQMKELTDRICKVFEEIH